MHNRITDGIKRVLSKDGIEYGFADLQGCMPKTLSAYTHGISILQKLDPLIIDGIDPVPTMDYYKHYTNINNALQQMIDAVALFLDGEGVSNHPVSPTLDLSQAGEAYEKTLAAEFPHKMAATQAGLGWIGKTDLLVSFAYGPRVRLATVLVDYPLPQLKKPVSESLCGKCRVCVQACPAQAANGELWNVQKQRSDFYNAYRCREYCRDISERLLHIDKGLCGKCVSVCPAGRRRKEG